jgi:flagellar motor protein MotB
MRYRRHAADEEGEGYFASISDLMVGILFVFLLMLTVFALNYRKAEEEQLVQRSLYERLAAELQQQKLETERQTAEARRQHQEADRQRREAEAQKQRNELLRGELDNALKLIEQDIQQREQARQNLLLSLGQQLHDRGIRVEVDERSGVLHISGDLLFATGSAALTPDAQRTVSVLASVLASALPCYAGEQPLTTCPIGAAPVLETVLIEGHTDRRPVPVGARYRDNDQLSTERALAVFSEMRKDQPSLDAIRNREGLQLLGEAGYGDRRPLPDALGTSDDDFQRNRRIDVRFMLTSRTSDELNQLRQRIQQLINAP